jgi:5-hydroxyisourate hydrolase-like protein (transthyretin family)
VTNADGRCINLLSSDKYLTQGGVYRIVFETKDYFDKAGKPTFYPWVEVRTEKRHLLQRENDNDVLDSLPSDQS